MKDARWNPLPERREYTPLSAQEAFIVPLLGEHIERALTGFGRPRSAQPAAIDVGCGGQPFRSTIEALGYRYTGVDPWPTPGVDVDHEWGIDAAEVPAELLAPPGFHLVLCTEVLEHVADWDAAFRNLTRLTAPGGRVILTCPAFYVLHEEPQDFWRPTDHAFRFFAERHGLNVVRAVRLGDAFDVLGTLLGATGLAATRRGPHIRMLRWLAARTKDAATAALRPESFIRRRLRPTAQLYLSNLVLLERPAD